MSLRRVWKLHISSTLPCAVEVFRRCAPRLSSYDVLFKSVKTLDILAQLNSGMPFGFSQVGKFITVYPATEQQAVELAEEFNLLTADLDGPSVPFDQKYRPGSLIHYRYGAFGGEEIELADGRRVGAIRHPSGQLVADLREPGKAVPDWITDPFGSSMEDVVLGTRLQTEFLCYEAMMQRGKGGVYGAVHILSTPANLCVVKEGRRHGETSWAGVDGYELVEREEAVLRCLRNEGIGAPQVIDSFDLGGNRYLAIEYIEGVSLHAVSADPDKKLSLDLALAYSAAVARLVAQLHERGWVWRDCKPANLLVSPGAGLRPVDFEGAVRSDEPDPRPWGSPTFVAPEARDYNLRDSNVPEDLFALGATVHQLCTSWLMHRSRGSSQRRPEAATKRSPLGTLRRGVPIEVRRLVTSLMDNEPSKRPSAEQAAMVLDRYRMTDLPVLHESERASRTVQRMRGKLWQEMEEFVLVDVLS